MSRVKAGIKWGAVAPAYKAAAAAGTVVALVAATGIAVPGLATSPPVNATQAPYAHAGETIDYG